MVTHEDVLQIAKLAKLSIREEELDSLTKLETYCLQNHINTLTSHNVQSRCSFP